MPDRLARGSSPSRAVTIVHSQQPLQMSSMAWSSSSPPPAQPPPPAAAAAAASSRASGWRGAGRGGASALISSSAGAGERAQLASSHALPPPPPFFSRRLTCPRASCTDTRGCSRQAVVDLHEVLAVVDAQVVVKHAVRLRRARHGGPGKEPQQEPTIGRSNVTAAWGVSL